jgi:hypothetical protein
MNMAHIRLSRPVSGLGVKVKVFQTFQFVPSSLKRGREAGDYAEGLEVS